MLFLCLWLKGMCIGASNVVPGISGGTIAVILGIYEDLIYSINNFFKQTKKSLQFLFPIGLGVITGILSLSSIIDYCLTKFSFQTGCFLVGLIAGSLPLVYKKTKTDLSSKVTRKWQDYFYIILGIIIVVAITLFKSSFGEQNNDININIKLIFFLFFGGLIASAAMIVPGISGAFMLMLLGLYSMIISAISKLKDFFFNLETIESLLELLYILLPLGVGACLGIIIMSKLIDQLLKKFYAQTYQIILGLIIGTIFAILMDPVIHQSYEIMSYTILFSGIGFFLITFFLVLKTTQK